VNLIKKVLYKTSLESEIVIINQLFSDTVLTAFCAGGVLSTCMKYVITNS